MAVVLDPVNIARADVGQGIYRGYQGDNSLAVRPGTPSGLGFIRNRPVFLLPGNPVACLCAYDLFAGRAIRILGGRSETLPYPTFERIVARKISSVLGRVEYARVIDGPGGVEPVPTTGAPILSSTVAADGFVLVPPDREAYLEGETVKVWMYSS